MVKTVTTTKKVTAGAPKKPYMKNGKKQSNGKYSKAPLATRGFYGNVGVKTDELKTIDLNFGYNPQANSGTNINLINGVAQGTDYNARVGRKLVMKSLFIRFQKEFSTTAPTKPVNIRVIVVLDKQTNGVLFSNANLLQFVASAGQSLTSPINLDNRDRFVIIKDKTLSLNGTAQATCFFKAFKRLDHEVIYGGTGATVGNITSGSLNIVTITDYSPIDMIVNFNTRVRFSDN